tara:strand:- start:12789 stop:13565 length:777 start_codon:yes stop_codon:yes gene_type:complete
MRRQLTIYIFLFGIIFNGCKSLKVLPNKTPIKNIKTRELTKAIYLSAPKLSLLRSRLKVNYDDGKRTQPVVVNLRMKKDVAIWLSATMFIPIAKLLLTPKEASFYEKFQKTSYNGNLSFLKDYLGIDFEYKNIENLLTGRPIIDIRKGKWEQIKNPNFYIISPKFSNEKFRPIFFFDPANLMLKEQRFIFNNARNSLIIYYNEFQKVEGEMVPSKITLNLTNNDDNIKLEIEYTRVEIPNNLTFPFSIPPGYSSIIPE